MSTIEQEMPASKMRFRPFGGTRRWKFDGKVGLFWIVFIIVAYLTLVPGVFLVGQTFTAESGGFTLDNLVRAFQDALSTDILGNSLIFVIGSAVVAMVLGTSLAYLQARTNVAFKPLLFAAAVVPLAVPTLLYTAAWVLLAGPQSGVLNKAIESLVGVKPFNILSMGGMVWVEGSTLVPIAFLLMLAAFSSMDPSLEESARVAGASEFYIVRRVTLPLVKPALIAAALLMAVRSIESFETPVLIGMPSGIYVFTSRIWAALSRFPSDVGLASAYSSVLLILAIAGVLVQNWLVRRGGERSTQTIGGKNFRARPRELRGGSRVLANAYVLVVFAIVVALPLLALLYSSFLPFTMVPSIDALRSFSLSNYVSVLESSLVQNSAKNSLILAIGTATVVMLLMSLVSWFVIKTKIRGRSLLDVLSFLPMVFPGIVLGLSILVVYLRVPLPIYGTLLILLIAYVTKSLPYGMRYTSVSMVQVNNELEEAAQVSGASWWYSFRRVIVPLVFPGLLSGWVFVAILSVRELSSSLLIYSSGNEVLSIAMFKLYNDSADGQLAALGVLLVIALTIVVLVAYRIGSRVGIRASDM